ncbi:sulfate ABC transporter permease subunit CysW [Helicobacter turcicus]|uniref:Sulfate ABC transporter permease subunit CysW n=1 Tax=Helicobacter turcicus TaxID=2867412 RepID=A0ABS7JKS0_9HELI|nr:sulfate ABC transporter permease subunit CysW [Helicobacter turcicus]MBX7489988.1 sulfate ABC transporter permease subunit CysW [Helicobacter turcicus]MBX7544847.1 sulfate ABC transporter permease subunit CysW [Helicobacter turcicus]
MLIEPRFLKPLCLSIMLGFLSIILLLPLITLFSEAFKEGFGAYWNAILEENTLKAIALTLIVACIVLPLNTFFGILIAYCVAKFDFFGKRVLNTLLEVPFAISPVIVGLMFVLLFGSSGIFGNTLENLGIQIVFALPGIILASAFITFPFVAKELIPLMQEQGKEEEEAALSLGASGWQSFWFVTLPNIKWGVFYGMVLTNARVMGEFGAVAVVSGKIVGVTTTMPLYIEILYSEYEYIAAFCIASLLTLLSILTLVLKLVITRLSRTH